MANLVFNYPIKVVFLLFPLLNLKHFFNCNVDVNRVLKIKCKNIE